MDENVGVFEFGDHLLGVGDEVGRQIAAIELHALDDVGLGLEAFGLLDRDDALIADLFHRLGDFFADKLVAIGRDCADLGDFVVGGDLLRVLLEVGDDRLDREIDAALQVHRVEAGRHGLHAFAGDRGGEHGRGGGAVAGGVVLLGGDFAHQLGAEVLELVGKFDFLGDGHAVLGDARRAEGFFDDDVAALRAERDFHRIVENFDAAQDAVARVGGETDVFGSHGSLNSWKGETKREGRGDSVDDAQDVAFLHDEKVFAVDLDLGAGPFAEQDAVAGLDVERGELAALVAAAGAHGDDFAFLGLFLGGIGNDDAAFGLLFAFDALDHDAVMQGTECHVVFFLFCAGRRKPPWPLPRQRDRRKACWHSFDVSANGLRGR